MVQPVLVQYAWNMQGLVVALLLIGLYIAGDSRVSRFWAGSWQQRAHEGRS